MITAAEARRQYDRAKRLGWLPMFAKSAASRPWCSTADLMGIGSRETNLDPVYLTKTGDHGNGFGLMQVDKRYFPEWTRSGLWRDPEECIEKGAQVLTQKRAGIIKPNAKCGSDWVRFNNNLTTFVLKLPPDRLDALAKLVESRM